MNFEEFIKNKKEELHTETPSFKVWNNIQQQLQPKKSYKLYWAIAASVIIIMGLSIFYLYNKQNPINDIATNKPSNENIINAIPKVFDTTKQIELVNTPIQNLPTKKEATLKVALLKKVPQKDVVKNNSPSIKTSINYTAQSFYDSVVLTLKDRIQATPVKWVDKDYFKVYIDEYKSLEIQEENWRKEIKKNISQTDFVMELIQINQRKLIVLDNLLKQINIINNKKGDTTQRNFNKIII
jgi:hypothetical protein